MNKFKIIMHVIYSFPKSTLMLPVFDVMFSCVDDNIYINYVKIQLYHVLYYIIFYLNFVSLVIFLLYFNILFIYKINKSIGPKLIMAIA